MLLVTVVMGLYYAATRSEPYQERVLRPYLNLNASVSARILRVLGRDATSSGFSVRSPEFSFSIQKGCDAIDPSALFVACVFALHAPVRLKLVGMAIGTAVLLLINLVRVISLFYVGLYFPKAFHVMHVDVWQPVFIVLAVVFWAIWAVRATSPAAPRESDVSS